MIGSDITTRVVDILQDPNNTRWPVAELLRWISDAQRAIVNAIPGASAINAALQLVPGTKQSLPAGGVRFLRPVRNMGADGSTPGRAIRMEKAATMDINNPDWHTVAAETAVKVIVFDEDNPKNFYTYPPVHAVTQVWAEYVYSAAPSEITAVDNTLTVDDIYLPAVVDYVVYRAHSKEVDYANKGIADRHGAAFAAAIGIRDVTDAKASPNNN